MMPVKRKEARLGLLLVLSGLTFSFALLECGRRVGETTASARPAESLSSIPQAHYAQLFGKRYRTKVDLYLFVLTPDPDYRYLGRSVGGSRFLSANLPAAVNRRNRGRTYGMIRILDVVPRGSELTIRAETHEVTPFSGIQGSAGIPMGFICGLHYRGKQMDDILAEFIQSHKEVTTAVPNQEIDVNIAAPIRDR
jgi:hypothetical protein